MSKPAPRVSYRLASVALACFALSFGLLTAALIYARVADPSMFDFGGLERIVTTIKNLERASLVCGIAGSILFAIASMRAQFSGAILVTELGLLGTAAGQLVLHFDTKLSGLVYAVPVAIFALGIFAMRQLGGYRLLGVIAIGGLLLAYQSNSSGAGLLLYVPLTGAALAACIRIGRA